LLANSASLRKAVLFALSNSGVVPIKTPFLWRASAKVALAEILIHKTWPNYSSDMFF
jgi:hypothetical protein